MLRCGRSILGLFKYHFLSDPGVKVARPSGLLARLVSLISIISLILPGRFAADFFERQLRPVLERDSRALLRASQLHRSVACVQRSRVQQQTAMKSTSVRKHAHGIRGFVIEGVGARCKGSMEHAVRLEQTARMEPNGKRELQ
jgi:hypothetical protein